MAFYCKALYATIYYILVALNVPWCVILQSFDRLVQYVNNYRIKEQSIIFILDCCHAGTLPVENVSVILNPIIDTVSRTSGVTLFAATEGLSKAYEREDVQQGVFTDWLFQGLAGAAANSDGNVTTSSLHDYVAKAMQAFTSKQRLVYKTTIIGESPILARGYIPQTQIQVSRLTQSKLAEFDNIFRTRINEVRRNNEGDRTLWFYKYYSQATNSISGLIDWMNKQEKIYPELSDLGDWKNYNQDLISIKSILADVRIDTKTNFGLITEEIGQGGFGTVYKVNTSGGVQAYKVYHGSQLYDGLKAKAFLRGYNAMRDLDHPNIVRVFANTQAPLGFFMQYVNGQNFRDWWNDDLSTLMSLLHIIAQTLENAHSKGVIHRDIKPENIVIDSSDPSHPKPFLTDFDLAWYSMATVYSGLGEISAFGHYLYAAPEQFTHPGTPITRKPTTDVYGFGQLCYFSVCGQDPAMDNQMSINGLKDRLKEWSNASCARKFLQLYCKCTEGKPDNRYQTMSDISSILLNIRNDLLDPDSDNIISEDDFVSEIIFSLFGFEVEAKRTFTSRSGRTETNLQTLVNGRIELYFKVIQAYTGYTGNFDQQRDTITRKLDNILQNIKAKYGKDIQRNVDKNVRPYAVQIVMLGTSFTLDGAQYTAQVVREITNSLVLQREVVRRAQS